MSKPYEPSPLSENAEFMASNWIVRMDAGLSSREQNELLEWLAADPRHVELFKVQKAKWEALDRLKDWRPTHCAEPNPDLLVPAMPLRRRVAAPVCFALAASVAIALGLWWRTAELTVPPAPAPVAFAVAAAYERRVLDDGTKIELNRGARFEVAYTGGERRVRLAEGEAFFEVVKDPARPFVVEAAGVGVRAIGTAFNVRVEAGAVDVLVTEGRVQVEPVALSLGEDEVAKARHAHLQAGERTLVARGHGTAPPIITKVDRDTTARLLAWKPRLLEFFATPLAEAVAEFNRHNRVQLVLDDPALGALPIEASFRADNVDAFVRALELTTGVQVRRDGDTIWLKRAR